MIKFIPMFACWKVNANTFWILASETRSGDTCLIWAHSDGTVHAMDMQGDLPDFRLCHACKWQALPATVRSAVRGAWMEILESAHGKEIPGQLLIEWLSL